MANLIAYREVRKVYNSGADEVVALDNFSLDVADGEFVTVVGRSGCGKTTLLKLTAGLLGATSGSIYVAGKPVTAPLTNVGIVFQAPVLLPWRKTLDNVLLQIEARKLDVNGYRKRALELLDLTGLNEPFGALDAITRDEMNLELLRIWSESKKTVLFITHSIPESVFLGDRVIVMTPRPGKVAEILNIDLPHPRATAVRDDGKFIGYVKRIRERLGVR